MQIQKKIYVKQVVTETSKFVLHEKFANQMNQLERECQQLLFEQRKLSSKMRNKQKVEQRFQSEINQRKDRMTIIQFKLDQLQELEIGQEIIEKEVDGIVNVEVGMDWKEMEEQTSIVIQDNRVIRIDQA
ncbi:MAG TPA: YlqD family protein [Pseudogracilibacillus sp.]|nr:YlqD family protein [Pseudogracilibacillus sp.]